MKTFLQRSLLLYVHRNEKGTNNTLLCATQVHSKAFGNAIINIAFGYNTHLSTFSFFDEL